MYKKLDTIHKEDRLFANYKDFSDSDSFHELFAMVSPWLLKMIFRITCDLEVAKDIEQDTWLCLIEKKVEINKNGKITNLIFTIAKNNALMWKRKEATEIKYKENNFDHNDKDLCLEVQIENNDTRRIIKEAITILPKNQQDVILLHYLTELKIVEIANILDKPENSIKTWLKRGREKLGVILNPVFEEES